jgi:hypothetical protein
MRFSILFLLTFFLLQTVYSQDNLPSRWANNEALWYIPLSDKDKLKMQTIWKEIGEDLKTEENQFAGTFGETGYQGGYFLRWSVAKGFILIPYFDQNMIADFSYGKVEITKDYEIILTPEKDLSPGNGRFKKTPPIWIPVKYGDYLVPKESISSFGDFYGGFGEFNGFPRKKVCEDCGTFAVRLDEKKR